MTSKYNFTTGPSTLPDGGQLIYNGCVFSPLFETALNGKVVKDTANRTTKYMEYDLVADGYATLPDNETSINNPTQQMRQLLTAQAGTLLYTGRGLDLKINFPGSTINDVAWGPSPELLEFQPLGAGRSAKVKWQVKVRIPEVAPGTGGFVTPLGPVLQFTTGTSVTYGEDGFSTIGIHGTLEIPLTRATQNTLTLTRTVDQFRDDFLNRVGAGIDLTRFRVTRRDLRISDDKRTLEWDFAAEELPYMGLPPGVTIARGSYNFRPSKAGVGLANWLCTLRVTYTVIKPEARRVAWFAFLALLRERMSASANGVLPRPGSGQNPGVTAMGTISVETLIPALAAISSAQELYRRIVGAQNNRVKNARKAWLIDFNGDEGLYLDSKTMTFSATWRLVTTFSAILVASGLWRRVGTDGGNTWAMSVQNISGATSWLDNRLNPAQDAIVDFGE